MTFDNQEIIRQQLAEIEVIYQTAPVGLALLDSDLRFVRLNPQLAEINGVSVEAHIGRTVREIVPNLADQVEHTLRKILETGQPVLNLEVTGETLAKPGLQRTWLVNWVPVKNSTGKVSAINVVVQEITDRKQAEQEMIQMNRLKDEFLAAISHELRTPLNPIMGWAKILRSQKVSPAKVELALETIERNAKQQMALVDDLLDMSVMVQGMLNLQSQPVDLALTLAQAVETIRFAAQAKAIAIELRGLSTLEAVGDSDRLRQMFSKLLSNAIKFTPNGGQVTIELSMVSINSSTHVAQIRVSDTGIGIAPEFLPYVFDQFRQADGSTTRQYGGLGLGLAIVQHLVELHGGTVEVQSLGVGQGSTFIVKLPVLIRSENQKVFTGRAFEINSSINTPSNSIINAPKLDERGDRNQRRSLLYSL